jgi:hypothetical protein
MDMGSTAADGRVGASAATSQLLHSERFLQEVQLEGVSTADAYLPHNWESQSAPGGSTGADPPGLAPGARVRQLHRQPGLGICPALAATRGLAPEGRPRWNPGCSGLDHQAVHLLLGQDVPVRQPHQMFMILNPCRPHAYQRSRGAPYQRSR